MVSITSGPNANAHLFITVSSGTLSANRIQSSHKSLTSSTIRPSAKLSWGLRRVSITGLAPGRGLTRPPIALELLLQLFAIQSGDRTAHLPETRPSLLRLARGWGMVGRHI